MRHSAGNSDRGRRGFLPGRGVRAGGRVAAAVAVLLLTSHAAAPADRPNILWLVAEDTSATSLPVYGDRLSRTPTLDALAFRVDVTDRTSGALLARGYVPPSALAPLEGHITAPLLSPLRFRRASTHRRT